MSRGKSKPMDPKGHIDATIKTTYPQSFKHNLHLYKNCTSWRKYNILVLICPYCTYTSTIRTNKEGGGLLMRAHARVPASLVTNQKENPALTSHLPR